MKKESGERVAAENRKARHDYHILETYEAGIALRGTEVKSIRAGKVNLKDSFARIEGGEVFVYQMHISPYEYGNRENHDPLRTRKLLLHKSEIARLVGKTQEKGLTLVPLRVYFKRGLAKVELALAKGKKLYDKRHAEAEREARREVERALKSEERQGY
ncbi:MAG: SsrA-binding protein SmpB [Bacillota bacterium]|nr:SsrA-binding protein SmpB [Bacillota bacterium]